MDLPLGRYVRAAHGLGDVAVITKEDTLSEKLSDGVLDETMYRFVDGAMLRYRVEQDEGNFDIEPEAAACLPCEISYQVLKHPEHGRITPERKRFTDSCRHLFWLKMQKQDKD
ncbi:hypothetical protein GJV52_09785 [Neisseria brasiliensis]|uniref:hypothetical protein n=1 Tax=Neisseria TaxID=482 RepID=UPI000C26ECE4|nr:MULTISPECIES: hypothetical protein [Neisseria]PJO77807.1 hypothetical protein CWC45_08365 [Neisseria sp. N177_16]QGL25795.1 hypothetical protein GJV52_09785 [Neisseria brasiliensis]